MCVQPHPFSDGRPRPRLSVHRMFPLVDETPVTGGPVTPIQPENRGPGRVHIVHRLPGDSVAAWSRLSTSLDHL